MKKILIHTVTNPCVDKSSLELFFLKCNRFINKSLGDYEFHLHIDTWQALVTDEFSSLIRYSIDTNKYKSDKFHDVQLEINESFLKSQNNIKEIVDEIVKENKHFTNSFKTIKITNSSNTKNYSSDNHFNIIGNTFKNTYTEYDFYVFKSINSLVIDTSSLSKAITHLNNTNVPFIFTNTFFKEPDFKNNILNMGVDTLNLFVINNNIFFDYLKEIDNNPKIKLMYPNGDTFKISETFLFGVSDWWPDDIQNKTIPRIEYTDSYSDFDEDDRVLLDVFNNNSFLRKGIEAGPFLLELILLIFYKKNLNKKFNNVKEVMDSLPSEYFISIVKFNQHKQHFIFILEQTINIFSKNNNADISKLQYLLKETNNISSSLKKLLSLPITSDIDSDLLNLYNDMDNGYIDTLRVNIEEIIDKCYV